MITLEPRHGLVFLVIMLVQALRPWLERHKVDSAILPWLTLLLSCVVVLAGVDLGGTLPAGSSSAGHWPKESL